MATAAFGRRAADKLSAASNSLVRVIIKPNETMSTKSPECWAAINARAVKSSVG